MCSVTRIRRRLHHLPQLRQLLSNSGELFRCRRSSLTEGEHTIAFVSSFPFRFAIPVRIWMSSPPNLYLSSSLYLFCLQSPWPTRSVRVSCSPEPPRRSTVGRRHLRQVMRDAKPRPESPSPGPEFPRSAAREAWAAGRHPPPPARFGCLLHPCALVSTPTHSPRPPLPIPSHIQAPRSPNRRRFETTQELLYAMNSPVRACPEEEDDPLFFI
jgi:hypothetical protein